MKDKLKLALFQMKRWLYEGIPSGRYHTDDLKDWISTTQTVFSYLDLKDKLDENEKDMVAVEADFDSVNGINSTYMHRKEALITVRKRLQAELENLS